MGISYNSDSQSKLHMDATDNLYIVLEGSKQFTLVSPIQGRFVSMKLSQLLYCLLLIDILKNQLHHNIILICLIYINKGYNLYIFHIFNYIYKRRSYIRLLLHLLYPLMACHFNLILISLGIIYHYMI